MFDPKSFPPGTRIQISEHLGLSNGAIYQWKRVPAGRVLDVERLTGVPRWVLRPDIYPPADHAPARKPRPRRARPDAA